MDLKYSYHSIKVHAHKRIYNAQHAEKYIIYRYASIITDTLFYTANRWFNWIENCQHCTRFEVTTSETQLYWVPQQNETSICKIFHILLHIRYIFLLFSLQSQNSQQLSDRETNKTRTAASMGGSTAKVLATLSTANLNWTTCTRTTINRNPIIAH